MKVYGSSICPECREFKALMEERGFEVEYIDMTENVMNMREFLALRDHHEAFAPVREKGSIGIPAYVREDGEITLDTNTALAWIGQAPMNSPFKCAGGCK